MSPHDRLPPARHRVRRQPEPLAETGSVAGTAASKVSSYDVGYAKPPVHSRFKAGQSGNPKGRPKGSKNLDKMIVDILDERIAVNTPTGPRRVPRIEVLLRKLIELGGKGSPRAIEQALRHYSVAQASISAAAPADRDSPPDVTQADAASLAFLREMLIAGALQPGGTPPGASA